MRNVPNFQNRRYQRPDSNRKFYAINHRIEATELRVLNADNTQVGVLTKEAALQAALAQNLDLVLIAAKAVPPVAKIIDFKKYLYQEEKKNKEAKKGIKKSIVKDIKMSLFIGPADLDRLFEKTKEFLEEGNQVRLNLALKGREMMKKEMALTALKAFIARLEDANVAKEPRIEGRVIRAVVTRKK